MFPLLALALPLLALAFPSDDALVKAGIVTFIAGIVFVLALKYLDLPSPFKGVLLFIIGVIWAVIVARLLT